MAEFILRHTPEQNGVIVSFVGRSSSSASRSTASETFDEAKATIEAWIDHYDERRPHSRLGYLPTATWRLRQTEITA